MVTYLSKHKEEYTDHIFANSIEEVITKAKRLKIKPIEIYQLK
jgi:uncharacterized protein YlaI